ncbi:hypothetical protein Dimus_038195 [Dionaea muscipula]
MSERFPLLTAEFMPPRRGRGGQNRGRGAAGAADAAAAGTLGAQFLHQMVDTMREIALAVRGGHQQPAQPVQQGKRLHGIEDRGFCYSAIIGIEVDAAVKV